MNVLTYTLIWLGLSLLGAVASVDTARRIRGNQTILDWFNQNLSKDGKYAVAHASLAENRSYLWTFIISLIFWWGWIINWIAVYAWSIKIKLSEK